jgi:hypothetical protein
MSELEVEDEHLIDEEEDEEIEDSELESSDIDLSKETLEAVRRQNEAIAQRLHAQEQLIWQEKIDNFKRQYQAVDEELARCEHVVAQGIAEADGESVTRALKYRDECINKKRSMEEEYANFEHQTREQQQALAEAQVRKERYAKNFANEIGWHKLSTEAQAKIHEIDQALSLKHDASQRQYFSLLKKKVEAIVNTDKSRAKPSSTKKTYSVSRERRDALIQAGVWDDPKLRLKYVKQYQKWDRENADQGGRYDPF